MEYTSQESQRSGRDKSISINHTYINSGEYKRKFDRITDTPKLNRLLYQLAKKMLYYQISMEKILQKGYNKFESQLIALRKLEKNSNFYVREVV